MSAHYHRTPRLGYVHPADKCSGRHGCQSLVVIDPEDRVTMDLLGDLLERHNWRPRNRDGVFDSSADLADALRDLIAPPKPEEPTGLGAVVEDAEGELWVRADDETKYGDPWFNTAAAEDGDGWEKWVQIDAVRVLSEGVQP